MIGSTSRQILNQVEYVDDLIQREAEKARVGVGYYILKGKK
jgi:hypothetical protein